MKGGWTDIVMITEGGGNVVGDAPWMVDVCNFFGGARRIAAVGRSPAKIGRSPSSRSSAGFSSKCKHYCDTIKMLPRR
jgi:hypothetical protein